MSKIYRGGLLSACLEIEILDRFKRLNFWRGDLLTRVFTWALTKHGIKAGQAAAIAGALGATLPDLPSFTGTAYFVGVSFLWEGLDSIHSEEVLEAIYFTVPFGAAGSALLSVVPVALLLALYGLLGLGRRGQRRILLWILLWFSLGWLGHTIADFLTHVDDTRPLFWPISGWEWSSPVSYYNPLYYGQEFFAISHGLMLLIILWLLVKRILVRRRVPKGSAQTD